MIWECLTLAQSIVSPVTGGTPQSGASQAAILADPKLDPKLAESFNASWAERLDIFHGHIGVFVVAFLVTLLMTPVCRKFAIDNGIIDRPDEVRKHHKFPIAYLGGLSVYLGILAAIGFSMIAIKMPEWGWMTLHNSTKFTTISPVPWAIVIGMTVVMLVGLFDDVTDIAPMQKIAGQLFAAAALAYFDIGVKVAAQVLTPIGAWIGNPALTWTLPLGPYGVQLDLIYWAGTVIIALFVLGACNASNLVDGLDGLLSGVTAIAGIGLLVIALGLASADDGPLDHTRIVLCMAMVGACLGFLPHNFNPATIFLGDTGSLLLGYVTIVIVLSLGDTGQTHLVLAGLVIYAIPILDTALAIIRRKLAGKKMSEGDSDHLHHMLKRAVGVKGAALILYAMGFGFAVLGVIMTLERARVTYALVIVVGSFIVVTAIKQARRKQFEEQAKLLEAREGKRSAAAPTPPAGGEQKTAAV